MDTKVRYPDDFEGKYKDLVVGCLNVMYESSLLDANDIKKVVTAIIYNIKSCSGSDISNTFDILCTNIYSPDFFLDSEDRFLQNLHNLVDGKDKAIVCVIGEDSWIKYSDKQKSEFKELIVYATKTISDDIKDINEKNLHQHRKKKIPYPKVSNPEVRSIAQPGKGVKMYNSN